jgi:hypothetical protein
MASHNEAQMIPKNKLDGLTFSAIVELMDDDLREELHLAHWPCTPKDFLRAYVAAKPEFETIIKTEFGVEL